jgi:ABC-type bacteriocin/lantibiotic exporter with double-glycine peptidase domain
MMLSGKLSVGSLVAELVKAGRLSDSDAKLIQVSARQLLTQGQSQHALEVIAAAAATDQQQPSRTLDLEVRIGVGCNPFRATLFSNRPIKD